MGQRWKQHQEGLFRWAMLGIVLYLGLTLGVVPSLPTDDDGAYAAAAYQMWQTGRPGVPGYRTVVGMGEEIYLLGQLGALVQGAGMALGGVSLRMALLPSWFVGVLLLGLVHRLARRLWGRETGWLAVLLLSLAGVFFQATHSARPDLLVALFLVIAVGLMVEGRRPGWRLLLAGVVMGISGDLHPNGFLLVPVPFTFWWLLHRPTGRDLIRAVALYGGGVGMGVGYWVARHYLPDPEAFTRQNSLHGLATHGIPLFDLGLGGAFRSEAQRYLDWFWGARGHRHLVEGLAVVGAAVWLVLRGGRVERALVGAWGMLFLVGTVAMSNTFGWYLIFAWPFFALWMARAAMMLVAEDRFRRGAQLAILLVLCGYLGNHLLWGWKAWQADSFADRVAKIRLIVPPESPVLASAGLWFAFWDRDFTHEPYLPFRALEQRLYPETGPTGWAIEQQRLGWRYVVTYGNLRRFLDPSVPLEEILAVSPWRERAEEVRDARSWSERSLTEFGRLTSSDEPIVFFRVDRGGEKEEEQAGEKKGRPFGNQ
jgi:hypothetical protein